MDYTNKHPMINVINVELEKLKDFAVSNGIIPDGVSQDESIAGRDMIMKFSILDEGHPGNGSVGLNYDYNNFGSLYEVLGDMLNGSFSMNVNFDGSGSMLDVSDSSDPITKSLTVYVCIVDFFQILDYVEVVIDPVASTCSVSRNFDIDKINQSIAYREMYNSVKGFINAAGFDYQNEYPSIRSEIYDYVVYSGDFKIEYRWDTQFHHVNMLMVECPKPENTKNVEFTDCGFNINVSVADKIEDVLEQLESIVSYRNKLKVVETTKFGFYTIQFVRNDGVSCTVLADSQYSVEINKNAMAYVDFVSKKKLLVDIDKCNNIEVTTGKADFLSNL